jgi:hypothetical protein
MQLGFGDCFCLSRVSQLGDVIRHDGVEAQFDRHAQQRDVLLSLQLSVHDVGDVVATLGQVLQRF